MDNTTIVIAKYKEDTSWVEDIDIDNVFIVEKDIHIPNVGREPSSYIWYILENYDTLEGRYFFTQGRPMDHWPNMKEDIANASKDFEWYGNRVGFVSDMTGSPHDSGMNIRKFLKDCGIEYTQNTIKFNGCCLFSTTAELLKSRPKEYYQRIMDAILSNPKGDYAFERCVGELFSKHSSES